MITPRHNPLPILRPSTKPSRLNLVDASACRSIIFRDASALFLAPVSSLGAYARRKREIPH
jgi:hypothetical protein